METQCGRENVIGEGETVRDERRRNGEGERIKHLNEEQRLLENSSQISRLTHGPGKPDGSET